MTEPTHCVSVSGVRVTVKSGLGGLTRIRPGLAMPSTVTVVAEDLHGYDVEVEVVPLRGRLTAREVRVRQRENGPPVTSEVIRSVPVARLVQEAAAQVMSSSTSAEGVTTSIMRQLTEEHVEQLRAGGPTDAALDWVAYLYRLSVAVGEPPTRTVEQVLGLPRSTAGRWVSLARQRGFLGRTESGKAGEVE